MSFVYYNPNPRGKSVGDCVVRGISKLLNQDWLDTYIDLCFHGALAADMPSGNAVWSSYLMSLGYDKYHLPNMCPNCYTIKEFCEDHPHGSFLLAVGDHVVAVVDGDYYDAWDSGSESVISYFTKDGSE